ncbi:MAG: phage tail tape measure protein [Candidatus Aminicenantes bacterium]|nr:MAG: phage tail tape measure protein [Candidatus Aminicenantes bacterium]
MSENVDTINIRVKITDDGSIVIDKVEGKIGRATQKITGHFEKAKKGLWETFKQIGKTAGIIASTTLLVTTLSGAVRNLVQDTILFESEFTQVRTLLDETKTNVAGMQEEILNMSGALGDATNIARGTYQMISSGQDAESALKNIGEAAKFAQGGQVALRDAVSVGTVYLNAYGEAAGGLSHIYDVLWQTIKGGITTAPELAHAMGRVVPIAKEAGLSIEELNASIAVMTQISGNTNETVTSLRGILSEIIKPSEEAAKEAERLGINFSMAGVKAMGFSNWLADLVQKVKQGDGDMAKLFGRVDALNGIFQLTRNNLKNFTDELEKHHNVQGNNLAQFEKYKESFQGAWETMKNKLQAIFIQNILPLLKDVADWISKNSENISNFVEGAISGLRTVIGVIGQFKDVIIIAGKVWLTYFALSKINAVFKAFSAGTGVINQFVVGFVNLKKYGLSTMDSLKGSFRTATGVAGELGAKLKAIPPSIKISVALIGAELVGRALAHLFDEISRFHEREMAQIIDSTRKYEGEVSKLTLAINDFRQAGAEYENTFREIKKRADSFADASDSLLAKQRRIWNALQGTDAWIKYQEQLKNAGTSAGKLSISLEENQQVFKDLAKTVGDYTQVELDSLIKQGIITKQQKSRLLELQNQYKENQKVIAEQRKAFDELAKSMEILTKQGYEEQSKTIKDLLSLYPQYKTQIIANVDTLKKWVDKIDELWKTALPEEKNALEKVREELVLGYGEYNKQIVSIGEYENGINKALSSLFPFTAAIYDNKDALYAQSLIMVGIATNNFPLLMKAWEMMGLTISGVENAVEGTSEAIKKWIPDFKNAGDVAQWTGNILGSVEKALSSLGLRIDENTEKWFNFGEGLVNVFTGIASKNPAGIIQGIAQAFSSLISIIAGKSGEFEAAERRLSGLSGVTGDWAEKIEELAKQLGGAGSAERAFNMLLPEIIRSTQITVSNFSQFINKTREIIAVFEWANVTAEETARNFGAAFAEMAKAAHELGLEGGHEMTGLILLAEEFGLKIKEIQEYIESNKKIAIEGYKQYLEAAFSDVRIGVLDEWVAFEEKVKNNQALVDGVKGVGDSLIGLSNNIRLSQEQYTNFQLAANDAYSSLISQGFTAGEALQIMQPMLERLAFLQQQYNYQVDESTQALINQGIEAGLISEDMKTENQLILEGFDRIVTSLDRIALGLGVHIPEALGDFESATNSALSSVSRYTGHWSGQLDTIHDQFGYLKNQVGDFERFYDDIMIGHSIVTDTIAWKLELQNVKTEFVELPEKLSYLEEEYSRAMFEMAEDTQNHWVSVLEKVAEKIGIEIPNSLTTMEEKFQFVMSEMNLSSENLILNFRELLELYGELEFGGIGSNYGVYSQEEKEAMTAEFITMKNLWASNWQTIVQDEDNMRRFLIDIKRLEGGILDEFKREYGSFLEFIRKELEKVQSGYYQGSGEMNPGFSMGGWFQVPPGFPNDSFPLYVESGELVRIFSKEETQLMKQGFPKVGSDSTPLTPFEIPRQTLQDFFTPPEEIRLDDIDDRDVEIQLNDGLAPVYVPGQTETGEKKIQININMKIENIEINIDSDSDNNNENDPEKMQQVFAEMINDNFRGIGEKIADAVARKLEEFK